MASYKLRNYQLDAVEAAMSWIKKNSDPALLELSGGAGKSLICAELAKRIYHISKKRILVLVPSEDLLIQNGEKMELTGEKFSFYSASVSKSLRHKIVLATEGTFKAIAERIGDQFAAVIVDEADRVTPTFKAIIDDMRKGSPNLRVIGMTGTPFRAKTGYIYELDIDNRQVQDAIEPYYKKLLYRVTCNELIALGFLTPVQIGVQDVSYNTNGLKLGSDKESFTNASEKSVFEKNSLTKIIIDDVIAKTRNAKGILIFAATLDHAREIMSYLPEDQTVFLHGGMPKSERRKAVADFKAQRKKYLVNRDIASVGFDAPHADFCVLMRSIGSNRLFQQIVWRVVRLSEGKDTAYLLDYGKNVENLFDGEADIFTPKIKTYGSSSQPQIEVSCPECGTLQEHTKRQGYDSWSPQGYATDLTGEELDPKIPAHYGRRCCAVTPVGKNQYKRCDYYWTHKECPVCAHKNDIAARSCEACGITLIDPTQKLSDQAIVIKVGERMKTNVNSMKIEGTSVMKVTFDTQHGEIISKFYPNNSNRFVAQHAMIFDRATDCGTVKPRQIVYSKSKNGYFTIHQYLR